MTDDDIHEQMTLATARQIDLTLEMVRSGMLQRWTWQQHFREKRQRREARHQKQHFTLKKDVVNKKIMSYDIRTAAKRPRALPLHNLGEQSHGCGIVNRSLDALAFPEILKPAT